MANIPREFPISTNDGTLDNSPTSDLHTPVSVLHLLQSPLDCDVEQEDSPKSTNLGTVDFNAYRFLKSDFLHTLPQDDIKYLEEQSCLRVPQRNILDEMVNQYFHNICPLLPLLNEAQFWRMYHSRMNASGVVESGCMSLFVLQAMLFISCSFVSCNHLRSLGFQSIHRARRCFYRRAKVRMLRC